MSSWADEIDDATDIALPRQSEKWVGNTKITTEYTTDENDKKIKVIRTYKIEKKLVSKNIAIRKKLDKFGKSRDHGPGPNSATTVVSADEITMNFFAGKDEDAKDEKEKSAIEILKEKAKGGGVVKCRICKEDHWTTNCPYKETLGPLRESLAGGTGVGKEEEKEADNKAAAPAPGGGG